MTPQAQVSSHSEEDLYIARVIDHVPPAPTLRAQIAMDLRSHIAERLDHQQSIDQVIRQLGDPRMLAESYLGAVPLVAPTFWIRTQAKLIDFALITAMTVIAGLIIAALYAFAVNEQLALMAVPIAVGLGAFALILYPLIAEYRTGQTFGKRVHHLRVVTEAGARISLGQSIVRQLPWLFQVFLIDAAFALFTDKSQRAAEIISKTRVVCIPTAERP